jgi:hypothetical protein
LESKENLGAPSGLLGLKKSRCGKIPGNTRHFAGSIAALSLPFFCNSFAMGEMIIDLATN